MLALESSYEAQGIFHVQRVLGRAMGRVLAHEVYHAVLRTPSHAAHDIAKPSLTPAELFGPELRFDSTQIAHLISLFPSPPSGS
jgi:hypothetical protein